MTTTTTVPTPDLTAMTLPDLHAHVRYLEQTRERLTADLPDIERRAARQDPIACYEYFTTHRLLEQIDNEVADADAEIQFRAANRKPVPSWWDVGLAVTHSARLAMAGHYRGMR